VPIEIPSDTVIVLKIIGAPPASLAPLFALSANSLICTLHGVTSLHVLAIPTIGFLKSSSVNPTARSIALLGALVLPSKTLLLIRKSFIITDYSFLSIHYIVIFLKVQSIPFINHRFIEFSF